MRRHPDTGWRTGDFVRKWHDADRVYRIDGVSQSSTRLTLVPCCARAALGIADGPGTACPLDLIRATEEDIPTDEREAAILALEMDGCDEGLYVGESCALIADQARALAGKAYSAVHSATRGMFLPAWIRSLNAAALLRDGWNPGDPVEVLP